MTRTEPQAYAADIKYGTQHESGVRLPGDDAHARRTGPRGHNCAGRPRVDSILIDEAPYAADHLGPADASSKWYGEFARIAPLLKRDVHYEVDIKKRTIGGARGRRRVRRGSARYRQPVRGGELAAGELPEQRDQAKELYQRDKDYIVRDGEVIIVDEFTGRILVGRRYNEGMHQAIEAKEKVEIKAGTRRSPRSRCRTTSALRQALGHDRYGRDGGCRAPPDLRPRRHPDPDQPAADPRRQRRPDLQDRRGQVRRGRRRRRRAAQKGQPVLIGTTSVERSEYLSKQFTSAAWRTACSTRSSTSRKPPSSPRPAVPAP
ncbi:hypothetical protein GS896_26015 [Rhodococcus hoagii]|nr:hypothetical protein [Prescottella equi]